MDLSLFVKRLFKCKQIASKMICRACLDNCENSAYSLFKIHINVDVTLAFMLKKLTSSEPEENDGLPDSVCISCFKLLRMSYNFVTRYYKSQNQLTKTLMQVENQEEEEEGVRLHDDEVAEIVINPEESDEEVKPNMDLPTEELVVGDYSNDSDGTTDSLHITSQIDPEAQQVEPEEEEIAVSTLRHKCPICEYSTVVFRLFNLHVRRHADQEFKCTKCEQCFSKNDFIVHYRTHRYQCKFCFKTYKTRDGLWNHRIIVHKESEKPFACSYKGCKRTFVFKQQMTAHFHSHSDTKQFLCEQCGKAFRTYSSQYFHMTRVHQGRNITICSICGKQYTQYSNYMDHMWVHTGEKRHQCEFCGMKFSKYGAIAKHRRTCKLKKE